MLKIGFVDDHESILFGLSQYFTKKHKVSFTTTQPWDVFELIKLHNPDILIIDVVFPNTNYIDFYVELRKKHPEIRIVSYTSLSSPILDKTLLNIGVFEIVNKGESLKFLEKTINNAFKHSLPESNAQELPFSITKTELNIIQLLADGKTTKGIAKITNRSNKTIENHRSNILIKMNVSNVSELISLCYKAGVLS